MIRKLITLLAMALLFSAPVWGRQKIILDTDPAMGYPFHDVDDGLAMGIALNSPELEVLGITTTYGNHTGEKTHAKALEIMAEAKSNVPVYRGADGPEQFSETPASKFIRETVLANPGEITIIAIGPLTNLAGAIKSDPKVAGSIKRVVSMGGALQARLLGTQPGAFDMNWGSDQKATQIVIESVPEFVMISTDLCMEVVFTKQKYQQLKSAPFLAGYFAKNIKPWLDFNRIIFHTQQGSGFFPWDTLAIEYVLDPSIFTPNLIKIATRHRGKEAIYIDVGQGTQINAPLRMDREKFWKLFFERV
jgi:purine nucleosidase